MPITTHTTVSIAKTLIWSHTRTATDRGGGSSLFDTSLLEHAIACTGINFSCSDSIMLAAARRKGVRRRRRLRPTAGHSETAGQNGPASGRDFFWDREMCALYIQPDRVGGCISVDARAAVAKSAQRRAVTQLTTDSQRKRSVRTCTAEAAAIQARVNAAAQRAASVARGVSTLCAHQGQPLPDVETPRPIDEAEQEQKRLDRERLQEEARRKAEQLKAQSTQAERGKTNKKKNSADAK